MTELQKITGGGNGMLFIDSEVTGKCFHTLVVNADCVLSVLTDTQDTNLLTDYGLSGKTLTTGMVITTNGFSIKNVTPASGSLLGYNSNQQ